jgi:hypothetical protein
MLLKPQMLAYYPYGSEGVKVIVKTWWCIQILILNRQSYQFLYRRAAGLRGFVGSNVITILTELFPFPLKLLTSLLKWILIV